MLCPRCGAPLPAVPPGYRPVSCGTCGAVAGYPPPTRWRWIAHRPGNVVGPTPPTRPRGYGGPSRYPATPPWGFPPSIWRRAVPAQVLPVRAPLRQLRSVVVLSRAAAVTCLVAAGAEAWRYALLVRGRTEVLPVAQVRWSDALVISAGWTVVLTALVTALVSIPAIGSADSWARQRTGAEAVRSPGYRLFLLLTPVVNLYGAGVVLAEVDAALRMSPPDRPLPVVADRLRWRSGQLPDLEQAPPPADPARLHARAPDPVHRSSRPLVLGWWAAWVLGGVLALAVLLWSRDPGSLQARANLVELHVLVNLVAAVVAVLTAAVGQSWVALMDPPRVGWPTGWALAPQSRAG